MKLMWIIQVRHARRAGTARFPARQHRGSQVARRLQHAPTPRPAGCTRSTSGPRVHGRQPAFAHHHPPVDDGRTRPAAGAQQQRGPPGRATAPPAKASVRKSNKARSAHRPCARWPMSGRPAPARHRAWRASASRGHLGRSQVCEEVAPPLGGCAFPGGAKRGPSQTNSGAWRLVHQVRGVVAGTVHTQAHRHTGVQHAAHRGDTAGQAHVAYRAATPVRVAAEQADAGVVEFDAVRMPDVVAASRGPRVLGGVQLNSRGCRRGRGRFRRGAYATNAMRTRQRGRLAHQRAADRERRARRHRHVTLTMAPYCVVVRPIRRWRSRRLRSPPRVGRQAVWFWPTPMPPGRKRMPIACAVFDAAGPAAPAARGGRCR